MHYLYSYTIPPFNIIVDFKIVDINLIKTHENFLNERHNKLLDYIDSGDNITIPAIILCHKTLTLIDGHHRLSIFKQKKYKNVPCLLIDYHNSNIIINDNNKNNLTKSDVINAANSNIKLPPKSTKHMIQIENKYLPLIIISPIIYLEN